MVVSLTNPERAMLLKLVEEQRKLDGQVVTIHGTLTRAALDELIEKLKTKEQEKK